MTEKRLWTRDELILALALYFQLPFGRLNRGTPEVKELGRLINRTDNSAAMRLTNFAACDPYITNSGRKGLTSGIGICKPIFDEFKNDRERLYELAAEIKARLQSKTIEEQLGIKPRELEGEDRERVIKQRVNQDAFRQMILNNYNSTCAVTGINDSRLLIASHIIPWSDNKTTRLNPENGICLSALFDKAFDRGLMTIRPDDLTVMYSKSLIESLTRDAFQSHFANFENIQIILPEEHNPNPLFLEYHYNEIFIK